MLSKPVTLMTSFKKLTWSIVIQVFTSSSNADISHGLSFILLRGYKTGKQSKPNVGGRIYRLGGANFLSKPD